jgi:hypothetical protein
MGREDCSDVVGDQAMRSSGANGKAARRATMVIEFLESKPVAETIQDVGQEHPAPLVWLPANANVAVVYVGAGSSDREWLVITNRKTGERVKVTL